MRKGVYAYPVAANDGREGWKLGTKAAIQIPAMVPEAQLINAKQVRAMCAGIGHVAFEKWLACLDDFPQPIRIYRVRYWVVADIAAWIAKRRAGK